ncbi:hypothetical protein BDV23DRAFT_174975 [Aspergillus alliaceus]|uniref:Uncharacterized protein n=1 Tax=Petromyces alliaceus TaxID=209559 RepID=A0A5N7BYX4_PETAA|nr:hypothetical protein BDV23DRAFT_174975 [Aspergillus alliaceus]
MLRTGLLPDHVNNDDETPADIQQVTVDICSDLLNSGGYMTHQALDWRHHPNVFNVGYHWNRCNGRQNDHLWEYYSIRLILKLADEKDLQDIDLPEELLPLIYKSRSYLVLLLRKGINLQPTEVSLIQACEANCEESLQLLLNTSGCCLGHLVLETAGKHRNPMIMKLVVQALAGRRKRLQILAESSLPEEVTYQLGVNLKLADLLGDAGFRDLDEEDKYKKSSLMELWYSSPPCSLNTFLEKVDWFITKGADLGRQKSGSSTTALHFLRNDVGKFLHSLESAVNGSSEMHQLNTKSKELMRKIPVDNTYDNCCCSCSLVGCSGLTRFLHGLFRIWPDEDVEELLRRLAIVLNSLAPSLEPEAEERLGPCVLRFLAFQKLEITHTCSHWTFEDKEVDAEEINEIHDEERELIIDLKQLLVLSSCGAASEEEISKVLETGVVLYE